MIQLPIPELRKNLVDTGLIREGDFTSAVKDAEYTGKNFIDILISRRLITYEYYINFVSEYFKIPRADMAAPHRIPAEVLHLLPEEIARQKRSLVFAREADGTIDVAMESPDDLAAIEFFEKYFKARVKPFIATERFLQQGYTLYSQESSQNFLSVIEENVRESERKKLKGLEEAAVDLPIVSIVDNLVSYAVAMGASDIHIEALEDAILVRFRVDGILREMMRIPKSVHPAITARIKLLSALRIDEHARPQDGRFRYKAIGEIMDIRVAVMPTFYGEKIVMRLLRASTKPLSLTELGMFDDTALGVEENLKRTYGIILVTGPTGSGKTTTLYSMIEILNRPEVNVVTIEDPVEYDMRYVNQTQANPVAGITFASALRAFLRQDPNIIMVGEIRDNETADIAVNAALTGHLVLASLHTNDAPTSVPRLIDMSVPPFLVAAVVNIIVAQRLVRKIWIDCIESHKTPSEIIQAVEEQLQLIESKVKVPHATYKGRGCYSCGLTGYRGRVAIYEVANIDGEVRQLISNPKFTLEAMKHILRSKGMISMLEDGLRKAEHGFTTVEEVLRVIRE